MKKRTKHDLFDNQKTIWLILLLTCLLVGALLGSFFAAKIDNPHDSFFGGFLASGEKSYGIKGILLAEMIMHLCVFVSAFWSKAVWLSPLTLAAKGFCFSAMITTFVKAYGIKGYLPAVASTALWGFASITCLCLLGVQAMSHGIKRKNKRKGAIEKEYFFSAIIVLGIMLMSAALHSYFTPIIVGAVAKMQ